ncbi:Aig1 [Amphibalanus amphitrite]|uniref:Aig1 n=1 Tax=Amphibalanus amphitrite TaxID=1232801 RepID=A0A6A4WS59_AMPAM|nr:Aig1 [Amphibalanus amphitrite]
MRPKICGDKDFNAADNGFLWMIFPSLSGTERGRRRRRQVVCILFWGMYAISRELVFPEVMDLFYPSALNHGVHTAPVLLALLELVLVPHHFSSHHVSLALLVLFLGAYLAWTMYLALVAELWVYGVMKVLSWPLRIAFMAANLAFAIGLYLLGKKLDHIVWGKQKADAAAADQRRAKKHR